MTEKYLNEAKKVGKEFGIKTKEGIWSLANDLREIRNHTIKNGLNYVNYALENNLYDKDPYCEVRLHLNELEILEKAINKNFEIIKKRQILWRNKRKNNL